MSTDILWNKQLVSRIEILLLADDICENFMCKVFAQLDFAALYKYTLTDRLH